MSNVAVDPRSIPASFISAAVRDPAESWPGAPPNFGQPVVPHIQTVSGRVSTKAYQWADEALRDSRANADRMLTDCGIMECLEARLRSVALLNWHIAPEDDTSIEQKQLADEVTRIIRRTPNLMKMRWAVGMARWFGRSGIELGYGKDYVNGTLRTIAKRWEPRHGDKLVFRIDEGDNLYDRDQVGIRIAGGYQLKDEFQDQFGNIQSQIESTVHGRVFWLNQYQRKLFIVNKHIIEDGPFEDPVRAGAIHGVGIRDRIYWTWYGMIECLADVLSYLERSAFGIEIWTYPAGNDQARQRCEDAAKKVTSGGRTVLIVPKFQGEDAENFGVQHIEPGLGGVEQAMTVVQEYFGHKIKRYILGQTLTSEAAATGLGSGVADAHMATFADIIRCDAIGDDETLTTDLVRNIQLWNFPQSRRINLRFVSDTESENGQEKLQSMKSAWDMGARLKEEDVLKQIGASMPKDTDRILVNPSLAQQPGQMGMGGPPGMPGAGGGQDLQHLFGPLAGLLGDPGAGGQPPGPDGGGGGGPDMTESPDDSSPPAEGVPVGEPEQYAQRKRQIRSTAGQQPLPMLGDDNIKQHHLWRAELHPRGQPTNAGQFAEKPGGRAYGAQNLGLSKKLKLPNQYGQGILFDELKAKLHQAEADPSPRGQQAQQTIFQTLAESNIPPQQLKALLSGDENKLAALEQKAEETGRKAEPGDFDREQARANLAADKAHRDAMSAALDVPRDEALSTAQANRRKRDEAKAANARMLPSQEQIEAEKAKLAKPAAPEQAPVPANAPDYSHDELTGYEAYHKSMTAAGMTPRAIEHWAAHKREIAQIQAAKKLASDGPDFEPIPETNLFKRSGRQFEELATTLGIKNPKVGPEGAAAINSALARRPGGPAIAAILGTLDEHLSGPENFNDFGLPSVGNDAFRAQINGKFTRSQLLDAAKWASSIDHVDAKRWLYGELRLATTNDGQRVEPEAFTRMQQSAAREWLAQAHGKGESRDSLLAEAKELEQQAHAGQPAAQAQHDEPFALEQQRKTEGRPDAPPPAKPANQGLLLDEMHDLPGQQRFFGGEEERAKVKAEAEGAPSEFSDQEKADADQPPTIGDQVAWSEPVRGKDTSFSGQVIGHYDAPNTGRRILQVRTSDGSRMEVLGENVRKPEASFSIAGMSLEQAAKLAAEHGHENAADKIRARPSAWAQSIENWKQAKQAESTQKGRDTRQTNWQPSEEHQDILNRIGNGKTFSKSLDLLNTGPYRKPMEYLLNKGIIDRTEAGREVSYRIVDEKFRPQSAPNVGDQPSGTPDIMQHAQSAAEASSKGENIWTHLKGKGIDLRTLQPAERRAFADRVDELREAAKPKPSEGRQRAMDSQQAKAELSAIESKYAGPHGPANIPPEPEKHSAASDPYAALIRQSVAAVRSA